MAADLRCAPLEHPRLQFVLEIGDSPFFASKSIPDPMAMNMAPCGDTSPSSKVLLVEDDDELRDIVGDILEASGYDVVPGGNGKQAIEYLNSGGECPSVIVLDLMMPILSGWECLRAIKQDDRLSLIPVIVLTALRRDRLPGAAAILKKPFSVADLLDAVGLFARPPTPQAFPSSP